MENIERKPRLIDANILKDIIRAQEWREVTMVQLAVDWVCMLIDEAQTAGLENTGKWCAEIGDIHSLGNFQYCSACGNNVWKPKRGSILTTNQKIYDDYDFCPHCRADMRGKK